MTVSSYRAITNHLYPFILSDEYEFHAPDPALWKDMVADADESERDRMEFFGDKILHMLTAMELRKLYPHGTAGLYTAITGAVNSNNTFSLLMNKGKLMQASGKSTADAFETMVAAFYTQGGMNVTQKWFVAQFTPLLLVSKEAFDLWFKSRPTGKHKARKRARALSYGTKVSPMALAISARKRTLRNLRLSARTPSKLATPFKTPSRSLRLVTPANPTIEIIDLTNCSDDDGNADDWEDEEELQVLGSLPKKPPSSDALETPQPKRPTLLRSLLLKNGPSPHRWTPPSRLKASYTMGKPRTPMLGSSLRPITIDDSDSDSDSEESSISSS